MVRNLNTCLVVIDTSPRDACLDMIFYEFDFEKDLSVAMSPKELEYKQFRVFTVRKRTGLPFHS